MIPGFNYLKEQEKKSEARPEGNEATFNKFGKEIKVHDFIQAGKDGTDLSEKIKEMGLQSLKGANANEDKADTVIDMSQNIISLQKIAKINRIKEEKLKEELKLKEEKKEENINGTN